ncbi:MAG TPA: chemotaxis response regulator protein-glutamate methylesterase [Polyangiaceae bacterium]|nr:chemotaxis response regulator protein-glutamate methylesterase [Polyangiaceae bacterium]
MIRVLIVDDSVVVRRMLSDVLASDARVKVVATASNGTIALHKLGQVSPDVVILDVEMPDMDGIETVRRLRVEYPKLPVIMCSSLTERGADVTLRALAAGATHYVTKPRASEAQRDGLGTFKSELLASLLALGEANTARPESLPVRAPEEASVRPRLRIPTRGAVAAVGIGCSTGGPNALAKLFSRLPPDLPVPIFIAQHMPPLFTRMLADSLTASSGVSVHEAEHGGNIEPGHAYIAPGDFHLVLGRDGAKLVTLLNQGPPENSCRPAVDVLFRSLASIYGNGTLACVLTGMGRDGTRGAQEIVKAGGAVLIQSPDGCVVPSMPEGVAKAGLAEAALPLEQLGDELAARARKSSTETTRLSIFARRGT